MQSVSSLFDQLGGPTKVARVLDVGFTTASEMKRRGSIPVKYWPRLVAACHAEGVNDVTYDLLVAMHTRSDATASPASVDRPEPSTEAA